MMKMKYMKRREDIEGQKEVEGECGWKRGKMKKTGVESELKHCIKSTAAGWTGWKEGRARSDNKRWWKAEWRLREQAEEEWRGFAVAQIRTLCWQNFECCHKTPLHYKALCVRLRLEVCTQVIISLCQQHESKVCVFQIISTPIVLGV